MKATDSRECRNCHGIEFMDREAQPVRARIMHALARGWGETCIDCHKGVAHALPKTFDKNALMDRLHERMEKQAIACRRCHTDMAGPPKGQGW